MEASERSQTPHLISLLSSVFSYLSFLLLIYYGRKKPRPEGISWRCTRFDSVLSTSLKLSSLPQPPAPGVILLIDSLQGCRLPRFSKKTRPNRHISEISRLSRRNLPFLERMWGDSRNHRRWPLRWPWENSFESEELRRRYLTPVLDASRDPSESLIYGTAVCGKNRCDLSTCEVSVQSVQSPRDSKLNATAVSQSVSAAIANSYDRFGRIVRCAKYSQDIGRRAVRIYFSTITRRLEKVYNLFILL